VFGLELPQLLNIRRGHPPYLPRHLKNAQARVAQHRDDGADRRTSLTLPNGVSVAYGYDAASQLTSITFSLGQTTLGNLTYGYDAAGNRAAMGGSWARTNLPAALGTATYDAASELTQWGSQVLSCDLNGNLTADGSNLFWHRAG
jgi:YD repeat-containing protein